MRLHLSLILMFVSTICSACTARQDATAPSQSEPRPAPAAAPDVPGPLEPFARMIPGEWKMTAASGTCMYDTWHWGPGRHSVRVMTHGEDAMGNPWRALRVIYWHPRRKQLCTLALNPYARSVSTGTVAFDGKTTETTSDLYQFGTPPVRRKIVSRDVFSGPDAYHSALLEETRPGTLTPLVEFSYARSTTLTPIPPLPIDKPPALPERLAALGPLVGHSWETVGGATGAWGDGEPLPFRSTFEWIPYADGVYASLHIPVKNGEPAHLLDMYFYHHTGTNVLRCLALSNIGGAAGVYEGDVTVLDKERGAEGRPASLQVDLSGHEGDRPVRYIVRTAFQQDDTLRHRIWSVAGSERTLMLDVHVRALGPNESGVLNRGRSTPAMGETVSEPDPSAWIVFQDRDDNYWFGSDGHGVCRYDGTTFTRFTTKDGLCNDRIREIQQDRTGLMFFTTLYGISTFDGQQFTTLEVAENDAPGGGWRLGPDDLWFKGAPGENGPYRYDGKSLYNLKLPKHEREAEVNAANPDRPFLMNPCEIYSMYKDSKGHMWFGTANLGVCWYDGTSFRWLYEKHLTETESGGSFGIRSIIEDKQGKFWICNTRYRFDVAANHDPAGSTSLNYTRHAGIDNLRAPDGTNSIYCMSFVKDNQQNLWMATYRRGVWRYDGTSVKHYPMNEGGKVVALYSIYKDNHGDLWLGTHEGGPYKFNGTTFEKWKP